MRRAFVSAGLLMVFLIPGVARPQQVGVRSLTDLSFGEMVVPAPGAGFVDIDPQNGTATTSNAVLIAPPQRGTFEVGGRPFLVINTTILVDPFVCDPTYLGVCVGTPSYTPAHTFPGMLSDPTCSKPKARCAETHFLGGRFSFAGGSEGRWDTTVTVIADYQ